MKRFPLLVAILLGFAVSASAQVSFEARLGRHLRGSVVVAGDHGGGHGHYNRGGRSRSHGHWETVHEQVLVPGYWRDEHVPPTYGWIVDRCGHRRWGVVDQGGCRRIWVPARWETRCRQVWVSC